ncbi:MAG: hypothetical protein COT74_04440 [Bdellovibrionales bacterium CG10_big_fil_rev_8_21_14_0_10_45_34]|nr:MAG: hypothetical protein COT74_04440 [Bdellovibrionales bacterium CG10_big_fil_rev_8_21_14_0_10_45_34]
MGFVSLKKRSKEEIEGILRAFAQGRSLIEISRDFQVSEGAFYRILRDSRGAPVYPGERQRRAKINRLEKKLKERDREIALLRSALKKS